MGLNKYRDKINDKITPIAQKFSKVNPNTITIMALPFAFLSAICFYYANDDSPYYFLLASILLIFGSAVDAFDGIVARITNKVSIRGDFLDHVVDRYFDIVILVGIILNPDIDITIGVLGLCGVFLTSYMGTQSQAVGHKRDYSGLLGRADRLVLLMIMPIVQRVLLFYDYEMFFGFYILELVLIYFAVMGNLTAIQRFYSTLHWFKKKS